MKREFSSTIKTLLIAVCSLLILAGSTDAQKNANDVIKEMQKKYETLHCFKSEFIQVEEWMLSGTVDTLRGTMMHMKEDYFSISTRTQSLMTDGEKVWDHDLIQEQLVIDFLDDSEDTFLLKTYMFDFPKRFITVDFREENHDGRPGYFISLEPKNPDEESIIALEVWIDAGDFIVKMARYTDFNDNIVVFVLENFNADAAISAESFKPNVPEGVKIIDLTKGDQ